MTMEWVARLAELRLGDFLQTSSSVHLVFVVVVIGVVVVVVGVVMTDL